MCAGEPGNETSQGRQVNDLPAFSLSKILFDKLKKHFQNFYKSSENAVIENERHP